MEVIEQDGVGVWVWLALVGGVTSKLVLCVDRHTPVSKSGKIADQNAHIHVATAVDTRE